VAVYPSITGFGLGASWGGGMSRLSGWWLILRDRVPLVLIVLALVAGGIWAVVVVVDLVQAGTVQAFDEAVLLAFREPDDPTELLGPEWAEVLVRDITALGGVGVLTMVTLAVLGYLLLTKRARTALFVAVAVVSGALLTFWLKEAFGRERPALVPGIGRVPSAAFPSGHTMMATVTYLTLAVLLARTQARRRVRAYLIAIATLLSILVGISRVYLAVHWPTDVLAGWAAGAVWALLGWLVLRRFQQRGMTEQATANERVDTPEEAEEYRSSLR
jgi:undecaprenyl-diphosphatase